MKVYSLKKVCAYTVVMLSTVCMLAGCDIWIGEEYVYVKLGETSVTVPLQGMQTTGVNDRAVVNLAEVIEKADVVEDPENYFYNFIASDGYSLRALLINEKRGTGLPPWQDMQKGYLYASESYELVAGWEEGTLGGTHGGCYNAKYMNGGTIQLLEEDIIVEEQ